MRLISLILGAAVILASASHAKTIKPSEAKKAVWAFEGNTSIRFPKVELDADYIVHSWGTVYYYTLTPDKPADAGHEWHINALTGEITNAVYRDAWPKKQSSKPTGRLTREQCLEIAREFARSKYAHFEDMGFTLQHRDGYPEATYEWDEAGGNGWAFDWGQTIERDAVSLNGVGIWVNANDGKIEQYWASRAPAACNRTLTLNDAIKKAKTAMKVGEADIYDQYLVCTRGGTFWEFSMEGTDLKGMYANLTVAVDAITGACVKIKDLDEGAYGYYEIQSASNKGHEDWVIASETLQAFDYGIGWDVKKRELRGSHGKNRVALQAGSKTVAVNGRQFTLSAAPIIVKGRLLAPEDLFDALQPNP